MHGAVHDYTILKTVKDGHLYQSGESLEAGKIKDETNFKIKPLKKQPEFSKVLEIGSLNINGSMKTYDGLFKETPWIEIINVSEYIGIDLQKGPCVDMVMNAHDLSFKDKMFDLVICLQMLEHDSKPAKTIKEAYRVLKPGKPFILTCASSEHTEHPQLGGGSEVYTKIKKEELKRWLLSAGFKDVEIIKKVSNFYTYSIK